MKFKMFSVIVGTEACMASCPFCVSGVKPSKENLEERNIKATGATYENINKEINYKDVEEKIEKLRKKSKKPIN